MHRSRRATRAKKCRRHRINSGWAYKRFPFFSGRLLFKLGVSRGGFYAWLTRPRSQRSRSVSPAKGKPEQLEIAQLSREVTNLKAERDTLNVWPAPPARVHIRCLYNGREGLKHKPECGFRTELNFKTSVCTRGRDFSLARIAERLGCPCCGSRRVSVMFDPPKAPNPTRPNSHGICEQIDDTETLKLSRYLAAGAQTCFLPSCRKGFEHSCFRGEDGHFYCTQECAAQGAAMNMSHVEQLRKPNAVPSPRRKLYGQKV